MNEINKYLNYLMKEAIAARFNMVSGKDVVGRVKSFDDNTIVLEVKKKLISLYIIRIEYIEPIGDEDMSKYFES